MSYLLRVQLCRPRPTVCTHRLVCIKRAVSSPLGLLQLYYVLSELAFSGVLHPRQVTVLTANFMSPPTVGATIDTVRV